MRSKLASVLFTIFSATLMLSVGGASGIAAQGKGHGGGGDKRGGGPPQQRFRNLGLAGIPAFSAIDQPPRPMPPLGGCRDTAFPGLRGRRHRRQQRRHGHGEKDCLELSLHRIPLAVDGCGRNPLL